MTYAAAHWFRHSNYIAVGKLKATMKIYIDMINKYQICKWVLVLHKQPPRWFGFSRHCRSTLHVAPLARSLASTPLLAAGLLCGLPV